MSDLLKFTGRTVETRYKTITITEWVDDPVTPPVTPPITPPIVTPPPDPPPVTVVGMVLVPCINQNNETGVSYAILYSDGTLEFVSDCIISSGIGR